MSPKPSPTQTSAAALAAAQAATGVSGGVVGEAGSRDAVAQLSAAVAGLKGMAARPLLQRAVEAIHAQDWPAAAQWATKALGADERSGFGWYLLGIAQERRGDFASSVQAYEAALKLTPDNPDIAKDLGRLAYRMGMKPQAEKLFRLFLAQRPDHQEGINNLACALRDQGRYAEAVEVLRPAIVNDPSAVLLWNTMGTVMSEQGDFANAEVFFQEALRLDPGFFRARYNLGNARVMQGDAAGALEACDAALKRVTAPDDRQMMRLARATILMSLGRIGEGWDEYEARHDPSFSGTTQYLFDRPRWEPGADLAGRSLLVAAEQGLGDEILFSNVLPDVIERLGPDGRLTLAVEPRLIALFQRTYPQARVVAHATYDVGGRLVCHAPDLQDDLDGIDLWVPMGSLLREHRRTLDAFPERVGLLTPDPDRVAHWRQVLAEHAPAGPKVGLLWKSAVSRDARHRYFSPFNAWAPVLKTPGVVFVNLQYGDCADELAAAERDLGVRIWPPPDIDLKQDLDEVAALCAAMDLVVGFANATLNIAAAVGAPTWLISTPNAWPRLGTGRYPFYPQVRVFLPERLGDWSTVMGEVAEALHAHTDGRVSAAP
ncbi:MAG: tetratricopeptide repeat protein [Pseudomonadota bacterium]|jgi:cytochrome c-type biogenesis protein CcmH/NrfG